MKKIWWMMAIFVVVFLFVGEVGGGEKEIRKKEIKDLVSEQADIFMILFDENQRISRIFDGILCVAEENQQCEELMEKFRKLAKMANDDLLEIVKLLNDLPGADEKIAKENILKIQEKLDWVSLIHGAVNNFLRVILSVPQSPQPVKKFKKEMIVSLPSAPSAHFFEVGFFLGNLFF